MTNEEALDRIKKALAQGEGLRVLAIEAEALSQILRSYEEMRERLEQSEARYIRLLNDPIGLELALDQALQSEAL